MRFLFLFLLLFYTSLLGDCKDEYSNEKYITAPDSFFDVVKVNLTKWFDKRIPFEFKKTQIQNKIYYLRENYYKVYKEYIYPVKSGVWKLHVDKNGLIDELEYAKVLEYQNDNESMANEINDELENLWFDWEADQYEAIMKPEDIKLHVKKIYFSLNLYMYGNEDNQLKLKNSILNFHIINNSHEVNDFLECIQKPN